MDLKATIKHAELLIRKNSPEICAGFAISGVIGTAYLAHEAGFRTGRQEAFDREHGLVWKRRDLLRGFWKLYIPPVAAGVATIGFIVSGNKISRSRTAAITAAYSLTERAFSEYKEKMQEKLGEKKEANVKNELAAEKIQANPVDPKVILVGQGVLCCETQTMRYFLSSVETLRKARNEINARINRIGYATVAEFYDLIEQPISPYSEDFGWTIERGLMEIEISPVLMNETTPCIGFDYSYLQHL